MRVGCDCVCVGGGVGICVRSFSVCVLSHGTCLCVWGGVKWCFGPCDALLKPKSEKREMLKRGVDMPAT